MAMDALAWAIEQQPATALQKLILLLLSDAQPRDYLAVYQIDELADDACSPVDDVIDALDALENLDLLSWHWRGDESDCDGYLGAILHRATPEERGVAGKVPEALVYLIEGAGAPATPPWSKVGVTMDLERRRRGLRRDTGGDATLHATWRLPVNDASRVIERLCETRVRFKGQGANWYALPPDQMLPYIDEVMKLLRLSDAFERDSSLPRQTH